MTEVAASLVEMEGVARVYPRGSGEVVALTDVTVSIAEGEFVAVVGPSGSGKSTLLSILGCLDRPSRGRYRLAGAPVSELDDAAASRIRNRSIGFIFQSFHLIPQLTVVENVETPLLYGSVPEDEWRGRALQSLAKVGLTPRADHRPSELSGGEAQRVAVARALVASPRILLADEPTGNLDSSTGEEIATLLEGLHQEGKTVILVTHNDTLARRARRTLFIRDGRIEADRRRPS